VRRAVRQWESGVAKKILPFSFAWALINGAKCYRRTRSRAGVAVARVFLKKKSAYQTRGLKVSQNDVQIDGSKIWRLFYWKIGSDQDVCHVIYWYRG